MLLVAAILDSIALEFPKHHWFGGQSMAIEAGVRLVIDDLCIVNKSATDPSVLGSQCGCFLQCLEGPELGYWILPR